MKLQVRNRHGADAITYTLTVMIPPPAPVLRFAASNWSSVTLQWSLPAGIHASANSKEYNRLSSKQVTRNGWISKDFEGFFIDFCGFWMDFKGFLGITD